ncbi:MAG: hypothetical protein LBR64_02740 [Dysgonamonadaceae bacterium]|jgi:hypothetical protein|nr:hypothetical protein [Dysgonamonadaceae bacterium]
MKKLLIFIISLLFAANHLSAQILIGSKDSIPMNFSALELIQSQEKYRGMTLPRMNQTGIDYLKNLILNSPVSDSLNYAELAKGLSIFNTDINCMMVWQDTAFWSLCGGPGRADGEIRNCSEVKVHGMYIAGNPLTSGHYISVPIWVTSKGDYEITAVTKNGNGYFFSTSGNFYDENREYVVNVSVSGQPVLAGNDTLVITFNGMEQTCVPVVVVNPATPDYTIVGVQPVPQPFPITVPLDDPMKYYATVTLSVYVPGEWKLNTPPVNGYQFSGYGKIEEASGFNENGIFPQLVKVIVPVTGVALQYGTGRDNFVMSTLNAVNQSNYPFVVELAGVQFTMKCGQIEYSSHFSNLKKDVVIPTAASITIPINVTYAGTTNVTATFAGVTFRSGSQFLALGDRTVTLYPIDALQAPNEIGNNIPIAFESSLGGLMPHYCTETVKVVEPIATFTIAGNVPDSAWHISPITARNKKVDLMQINVTTSIAGNYHLTASGNGITYSGYGHLDVGPGVITLFRDMDTSPENGPVGKVDYYCTNSDGSQVHFIVDYVYSTLNILSLTPNRASRGLYGSFQTPVADNEMTQWIRNPDYFGPEGIVKMAPKAEGAYMSPNIIHYTDYSQVNTWEGLANVINTNHIDIIVLAYDWDVNYFATNGMAEVLADFVLHKRGVLICGAEYNLSSVVKMMNYIWQATGSDALNTTADITQSSNASFTGNVVDHDEAVVLDIADEPLIKGSGAYGSFGDVAGKKLQIDYNNANWIRTENLPQYYKDNSVIIATCPDTETTVWYRGHIAVMRHKTLGFVYLGDSGWTDGDANQVIVNNTTHIGTIDFNSQYGNTMLYGNVFAWAVRQAYEFATDESYNYNVDNDPSN